ncbi:MAG: sodium:solute symporter [Sphingobacteriales bacterium]|nr:sodium:solute symporter [Sphingobacteriales bacterium]
MSYIDWAVLILTLMAVIAYGIYKSTHEKNLDSYFKSNNSMSWFLILLSIMGTQASAITFLSAPGQAYTDGMRFVQYYFGLPFAMIVLCITFVPIFHKLKVYTAYEFLEHRFDLRTRALTSLLFLVSRGLSTGISIYAPSIILSTILGWNIYLTNLIMGGLLIIYTMTGGAKAVAYTQMQQLFIVFTGMFLAGYMVVKLMPEGIGFTEAIDVAARMGKMNTIVTHIDVTDNAWWKDKYNLWSGLVGGFFLALSYFGTDQSQVGRYLTAKNLKESRMGLLMNGLVKVPMQYLILLVGVLVFSFYLFFSSPVLFNEKLNDKISQSNLLDLNRRQDSLNAAAKLYSFQLSNASKDGEAEKVAEAELSLKQVVQAKERLRSEAKNMVKAADRSADTNDTNYIFLYFVLHHLPKGLVGLLIAVIFLSAWGSIAAALNSLSSSTVIDLYKRIWVTKQSDTHYYRASQWITLFWGIFCITTAMFASQMGSLIEAVNILGSLFYGTMLGIFVVAFYLKKVEAFAVFYAAILAELAIVIIYSADLVSFLWLNVIGCLLVMLIASGIQYVKKITASSQTNA